MTRLQQALSFFKNKTKKQPHMLRTAIPPRHFGVLHKAGAIKAMTGPTSPSWDRSDGDCAYQLTKS